MSYELPCGWFGDLASLVACGITSLAANNRGKGKEPLELLFLGLLP